MTAGTISTLGPCPPRQVHQGIEGPVDLVMEKAGGLEEFKESGFRQESEAENRPHRAQEERPREKMRLIA